MTEVKAVQTLIALPADAKADIKAFKEIEIKEAVAVKVKPPPEYGVCDSPAQFAKKYPAFRGRVFMTVVKRADQSSWGGWRWHKWGRYVGEFDLGGIEYLFSADGQGGRPLIDEQWLFSLTFTSNVGGMDPYTEYEFDKGSFTRGQACTIGFR
jgi:hypothetical protein